MTIFISFISGVALFYSYKFFPAGSLAAFLAGVMLCLIQARNREVWYRGVLCIFLAAVTVASGVLYAKVRYQPALSLAGLSGETIELCGAVSSELAVSSPNRSLLPQAFSVERAFTMEKEPLSLREVRLFSTTPLMPGKEYRLRVQVPGDALGLNPGASHTILSVFALDVREIGDAPMDAAVKLRNAFNGARGRINGFISDNFSSGSGPFLMSQITGERRLLTKDTRDDFNATGLAHILSISGTHFGLLFFITFRLLRFLLRRAPYPLLVRLTNRLTPSQLAAVLSIPFMAGYLGISDMSIPAVRSFIMITLFLIGLFIQRRGFWLNTLLFAAVIVLLIQPESLLDLSFQLSFVAVLCIGIAVDKYRVRDGSVVEKGDPAGGNSGKRRRLSRSVALLRSALLVTLAATIGTAPLVAHSFHYFSLVSPLTNLIITPVIGFVILPLSLVSSFVYLTVGIFPFVSLIDAVTGQTLSAIHFVAQWSFVDVKVPAFPKILLFIFYGVLLGYVFSYVRKETRCTAGGTEAFSDQQADLEYGIFWRRAFAIALVLGVSPFLIYAGILFMRPKGLQVTWLDVGQGDGAVIELPDGRAFVVDTGKNGFQVAEFLRYRGDKRVDAIIVSHGHPDHSGGVRYLLDRFTVSEIWDNSRLTYSHGLPSGTMQRRLQRGDIIEGRGYRILILHPYEGFYTMHSQGDETNNDSLVVKIEGRKNAFLLPGDIGREAEDDLMHLREYLKSTVLKVPHHGSRSSLSEGFLDSVSPEIAVISAGRNNRYGHPHPQTLAMLSGTRTFRTDRDGAVSVRESPDGEIEVRTMREFLISEAKSLQDEWMNVKRLFRIW